MTTRTTSTQLTEGEFALSLLATGLLQLVQRLEAGRLITRPHSDALLKGTAYMMRGCVKAGINPPVTLSDVLTWCQRPIREWPLAFPEELQGAGDRLLIGNLPTSFCLDWVYDAPDVEAEITEQAYFAKAINTCREEQSPDAYTALRHFIITHPVLTTPEYIEVSLTPPGGFVFLGSLIHQAYQVASTAWLHQGQYHCCIACGGLLYQTNEDSLVCENERCNQSRHKGLVDQILSPDQEVWHLARGIRRSWHMPGLVEVKLADALKTSGIDVQLWPLFDTYDLLLTFSDGERWAIDVKDTTAPRLVALKETSFKAGETWDRAFYAFPDDRKRSHPHYLDTFKRYCGAMKKGAKVEALFIGQLKTRIRRKLERIHA